MKRRDLELLSAYLDGELKPSDSTKLESSPQNRPRTCFCSTDLRATRTLLRKLPSRKAPRNFTLTRKMAGQNPPLPRSYPAFRFATAVATLLFFFHLWFELCRRPTCRPAPDLSAWEAAAAAWNLREVGYAPSEPHPPRRIRSRRTFHFAGTARDGNPAIRGRDAHRRNSFHEGVSGWGRPRTAANRG
jgi:anti-sigma factor RsiW